MEHSKGNCHVELVSAATEARGRRTSAIDLFITGMGCPNCAIRVHNAIVSVPGVTAARVRLVPPIATVRFVAGQVTAEQLAAAVTGAAMVSGHEYHAYEMDRSARRNVPAP